LCFIVLAYHQTFPVSAVCNSPLLAFGMGAYQNSNRTAKR
jgi:hypothetical protein